MRIALAMLMVLMIGCKPARPTQWEEEVQLSDGRVLRVQRVQHWDERQQIGSGKYYLPTKNSVAIVDSRLTAWSGFAETPLILDWDVNASEYYLVTLPSLCERYAQVGRPDPPYIEYRNRHATWQRVNLQRDLIGTKPNLLVSPALPNAGPESPFVSLAEKSMRNSKESSYLHSQIRDSNSRTRAELAC